jgi:hypothetical protein
MERDKYKNNDDTKDYEGEYSHIYDRCDKAYEKYGMNGSNTKYDTKYDDSNDTRYIYSYLDYEELISLTKQEETKYTHKNIVFVLIKLITIKKTKEVSFKFDFKLGPYESWINIADYFNSNYVGKDYRILIDEDAIVCRLLNDDLIA